MLLREPLERLLAVPRRDDPEPVALERIREELLNRVLVVDEEDGRGVGHARMLDARPRLLPYTSRAMAPPSRARAPRARATPRLARAADQRAPGPRHLAARRAAAAARGVHRRPAAAAAAADAPAGVRPRDRRAARARARPGLPRPRARLGRARSARPPGSPSSSRLYGFDRRSDRFTATIPGRGRVELAERRRGRPAAPRSARSS